jgi:hypothetical protein
MLDIVNKSQEIELLIRRHYEMRWERICMWREARASFRLKYFTAELISVDQKEWEEFVDFESQNPFRVEKVQVDGQDAEVVVMQPSRGTGGITWIYYLRNTEHGWRIVRRKVQ